jgi:hypothetical protein
VIRLVLVVAILLVTAHRLPAPMTEETTPSPMESAAPQKTSKTQSPSMASGKTDFLKECPLKKGDPLSRVKEFYRVSNDPEKHPPAPGKTQYVYHFVECGVWVFFDNALLVQTLRFDRPFSGKIEGVSVGNTKEELVKLKGEPLKKFRGIPDAEQLDDKKKLAAEIIDRLPDPAPKRLVRNAFADVEALHALPISWNEAWTYTGADRGLLRYDIGSLRGKVQTIFSDKGTGETER